AVCCRATGSTAAGSRHMRLLWLRRIGGQHEPQPCPAQGTVLHKDLQQLLRAKDRFCEQLDDKLRLLPLPDQFELGEPANRGEIQVGREASAVGACRLERASCKHAEDGLGNRRKWLR